MDELYCGNDQGEGGVTDHIISSAWTTRLKMSMCVALFEVDGTARQEGWIVTGR